MADTPKAPPEPRPVEEGTVFIKNPSGAIHDMMEPHPGIDIAKKGDGGWRFASADEIEKYCELHNLKVPDLKTYAAQVKKLRDEALKPEPGVPAAGPSAEEAGLESVEPKAKAGKKA